MSLISPPVMIDFSEVFITQLSKAPPVRSRLEKWSPNNNTNVLKKMTSATHRHEEHLMNIKAKASQDVKSAQQKVEFVKQMKIQEAEILAAEIGTKVAAALTRAEMIKKKASIKGSNMSKNKLNELRKEQNASIEFTREMNQKRHNEALIRAEKSKQEIVSKCSSMSGSKLDDFKLKLQVLSQAMEFDQCKRHQNAIARAECAKRTRANNGTVMCVPRIHQIRTKNKQISQEQRLAQETRHNEALARVEASKKAMAEKAAKMSINKLEEVKKSTEESTEQMKLIQTTRHNDALIRAEASKKEKVLKGKLTSYKVSQVRSTHSHLELMLNAKKREQSQRAIDARIRFNNAAVEKIEKAHRMSGPGTPSWVFVTYP